LGSPGLCHAGPVRSGPVRSRSEPDTQSEDHQRSCHACFTSAAGSSRFDRTQTGATEWLGGIYYNGQVYLGIGVPDLNSIFVGFFPNTEVIGWNSVGPEFRPPLPNMIHLAFDGMAGIGTALLVLAAWQAWIWWFRREILRTRWFLIPAAVSGFAAVLAKEFGWVVTEVGRQPWTVYGLLLTRDAGTAASGVPVSLAVTLIIYAVLTGVSIGVPWLMGRRWRRLAPGLDTEELTPYGPPSDHVQEVRP
jgi:cytochrome bd ubiquinol oxidase subunit I